MCHPSEAPDGWCVPIVVSGLSKLVLLTTRETAEAEQRAIAQGTAGATLMERAGNATAELCRSFGGRSAVVLCGPGNNGGDGFVVARHLAESGWRVSVFALRADALWDGDAAQARARWQGEIQPAEAFDPAAFDLVVDALFGAGLARPLTGTMADVVARLNASKRPVVAVDMPSGVDGTTGEVLGVAVNATATITFGTAKPGHYLQPGRRYRGRLTVNDIGLVPPASATGTYRNAPALWASRYPWPDPNGHKYKRGHAIVVSGGASHTGAARLAARAALRIGAGLVTLATPADALGINASQVTAVMVRVFDGSAGFAEILSDPRKSGVVLGPGLGVGGATRDLVAAALAPQPERPDTVRARVGLLDADALTSFADDAEALRRLIATAPGPVVITPHDGEFARLFSAQSWLHQGSKLDRTRAAARFLGCTVLLKGADTVIAEPGGRAAISESGVPWLATAGSGDVLSGMIGGLLTQGMPPFEAAAAGDYLHTAAARLFGPGLIAEDLAEMLPRALRDLADQTGFSADPP